MTYKIRENNFDPVIPLNHLEKILLAFLDCCYIFCYLCIAKKKSTHANDTFQRDRSSEIDQN